MKLYWSPGTRAFRASWMLEEAGLDYERAPVDLSRSERGAALLLASPMGKVPALEDGAVRMWDSAAICMYLADRYAPGRLAPAPGSPDRGAWLQWMFFAPGTIEPAVAEKEAGRLSVPRANGWGSFEKMIEAWERGLEDRSWIVGDRFSAADVMLGSCAVGMRTGGTLPESPALETYADRCLARDAYRRALAAEGSAASAGGGPGERVRSGTGG